MVQHRNPIIDGDTSQYREIAESRSKIYWLLSGFFLEPPTAEGLQTLLSQPGMREDQSGDDNDCLLDELASMLRSMPNLDQYAQQLGIEYTRLFHGLNKGSELPPPYESVHRESRLLGETTSAVMDAYTKAGYQQIHEAAGPQDHLGVELRFLSLLCFDEAQFWLSGETVLAQAHRDMQSDFLDRHILAWIPAYCEALEHASTERYYQIIAILTRQEIKQDHQLLSDLRC